MMDWGWFAKVFDVQILKDWWIEMKDIFLWYRWLLGGWHFK
jgi:hypothetical protein